MLQDRKEDLNRRIRNRLGREQLRLQHARQRMQYLSPASRIREKRMQAVRLEEDLNAAMRRILDERRSRLRLYVEKLKGLSPLDKLSQGFSRLEDEEGHTLCDIEKIRPGRSADHLCEERPGAGGGEGNLRMGSAKRSWKGERYFTKCIS